MVQRYALVAAAVACQSVLADYMLSKTYADSTCSGPVLSVANSLSGFYGTAQALHFGERYLPFPRGVYAGGLNVYQRSTVIRLLVLLDTFERAL